MRTDPGPPPPLFAGPVQSQACPGFGRSGAIAPARVGSIGGPTSSRRPLVQIDEFRLGDIDDERSGGGQSLEPCGPVLHICHGLHGIGGVRLHQAVVRHHLTTAWNIGGPSPPQHSA